jgi:hypothetical protein
MVSPRNVFERKRKTTIEAERARGGGGRGRHTEAAVIVDVGRAPFRANLLSRYARSSATAAKDAVHRARSGADVLGANAMRSSASSRHGRQGVAGVAASGAKSIGMAQRVCRRPALAQRPPSFTGNYRSDRGRAIGKMMRMRIEARSRTVIAAPVREPIRHRPEQGVPDRRWSSSIPSSIVIVDRWSISDDGRWTIDDRRSTLNDRMFTNVWDESGYGQNC